MLKHKKGLLLILLIGCLFFLTACDYTYYLYHNTDGNALVLNKDISSIELIKYENSGVQNNPLGNHELDLERSKVLETLSAESFEGYLEELIKIGGLSSRAKQVLNSPHGVGVRIIYDDGSFTLTTVTIINGIECIFLGEYGVDEKLERYFGISWQEMTDDFKTLIDEYFTTQISWKNKQPK